MGFMRQEILEGEWIEVDGPCGTEWIPAEFVTLPDVSAIDDDKQATAALFEACREYCENRSAYRVEGPRHGFGARMSAPGYLDCTEWSVFETESEARDYLNEFYGDEDEENE